MDSSTSSLRLFYALWPDQTTRERLAQLQTGLHGRKTLFQNLHMTLAFLGSCPRKLLPVLEQLVAQLEHPELNLKLDRVGYFEHKQIVWAGMSGVPETLMTLQHGLMQSLAQHEVSINQQARFKPHVTLAREEASEPEIARIEPIYWRANEVVLVESAAQAGASGYRVLASQRFGEMRGIS